MTLTMEVPDDIAMVVSALPEADRRNITDAASLALSAALRSAYRDSNLEDESERSMAIYQNFVEQLRATLHQERSVASEKSEAVAAIHEAGMQYDSGERGLPLSVAIGEIRNRLVRR